MFEQNEPPPCGLNSCTRQVIPLGTRRTFLNSSAVIRLAVMASPTLREVRQPLVR